jgi:imidazoleglycerol phosphate synthase glutamine amidotransferase subunit HisH
MASTLKKLNDMPGRKYYFVRTYTMEQRAVTKVAKNRYSVAVRKI